MDDPEESPKTDQKESNIVFPSTCEASERIREDAYLEFFEEDIETIEIPIEIMRNGIVSAVGAMIFFSHACIIGFFCLFLNHFICKISDKKGDIELYIFYFLVPLYFF